MVCGGICSGALRPFGALAVRVYGRELCVDLGLPARRIDVGMHEM